jgi:NAD(P)-dependent dehydrogenase (short-subunit alcohol dehydrogenase family)
MVIPIMRVLVTGANGGLGPSIVEAFLFTGAEVAGVARSWTDKDGRFLRISADLSRRDECLRAIAEAGDPDVLVHVVGGFAGGTPVAETEEAVWDQMMNVNLRSAFLMFRAALPPMIRKNHGRIIAIGSRVGVEPTATLSAYGVSKAGLVHLIRTLAAELKDTGVTANIVMPSTIDTEANRRAMPKADFSKWVRPESIGKVVVWLASDDARGVNGAVTPVYGRS